MSGRVKGHTGSRFPVAINLFFFSQYNENLSVAPTPQSFHPIRLFSVWADSEERNSVSQQDQSRWRVWKSGIYQIVLWSECERALFGDDGVRPVTDDSKMPEHRYSIFIWQELIWPQTVWRPLWIKMRTRKLSFLIFSRSSTPLGPQPASFKHWKVHYFHFMAKDESEISHPFEKTLNDISENDYIIKYILIILLLFAHFGFFCSGTCFTKAYRERRSCSVLKPAKDWLRIIPLGPPGEWVPAAMISGMWGDTPGERKKKPTKHSYI